MEVLQESRESKRSFLSHVFSTTEEGKAEVLNVLQYAILALIPVFMLNKLIQRFIPEADLEKSSLELTLEIFVQLSLIFVGVILIHRVITYLPTWSGFKYENLTLINAVIPFLVIILSIQSKMGLKSNILYERLLELWNGPSMEDKKKAAAKKSVRFGNTTAPSHATSQADYLDDSTVQPGLFPPAPIATTIPRSPETAPMQGGGMMAVSDNGFNMDPMPANFAGSVFGSSW
jgi:hypothetical protein|uniref:Uncharacterized protein n=1 Tax=viral metagenome TaxID=1070528 RepID=A0A6C0EKU5_9ZZZZ